MSEKQINSRNVGLDILRFAAIMFVLIRHLELPDDTPTFLRVWQRGGWIGVDVFLVMSGFAIFSMFRKEFENTGCLDLRLFFVRRWMKIYPPLLALVAFTLVWRATHGQQLLVPDVAGEVLMLQNYAWLLFGGGTAGKLWPHTWTLAVIWHFYIVIACVAWVALRCCKDSTRPFRWVPWVFGLTALICLALRLGTAWRFDGYNHTWFLFGTHVRLDSLMFGVFLAYMLTRERVRSCVSKVSAKVLLVLAAICFAPAFVWSLEENEMVSVFGVVSFYVGSGLLIIVFMRLRKTRSSLARLLVFFGAASYSMFLWHLVVENALRSWMQAASPSSWFWPYLVGYIFLAVFVGCLMHALIEIPLGKMRLRLSSRGVISGESSRGSAFKEIF